MYLLCWHFSFKTEKTMYLTPLSQNDLMITNWLPYFLRREFDGDQKLFFVCTKIVMHKFSELHKIHLMYKHLRFQTALS